MKGPRERSLFRDPRILLLGMNKKRKKIAAIMALLLAGCLGALLFGCVSYRRPQRETVERSGVEPALVFAVMKAESGFREDAVSAAGAVGLMQLLPSTAEFICRKDRVPFEAERLTEGSYNAALGCRYLAYLMERFPVRGTALAAYNAGEGVVAEWLKSGEFSPDGKNLTHIPYPETARYVKKVEKFRKIYLFFYH